MENTTQTQATAGKENSCTGAWKDLTASWLLESMNCGPQVICRTIEPIRNLLLLLRLQVQ